MIDERPLELSTDEMRRLVALTMAAIVAHYDSERPPFGGAPPLSSGVEFDSKDAVPVTPAPFGELLSHIFGNVISNSLDCNGAGQLSYVPSGGIFHSAIADFIVSAVNRHAGHYTLSPGLVALEHTVVGWFARMMGLPQSAGGILTSGGSLANFSAIFTARRAILGEAIQDGALYLSEHAHVSIAKGALLAGLRERNIRRVGVDRHSRIKIPELLQKIQDDRRAGLVPFFLVGNAGTTNTGSVDSLHDLASVAGAEGLWFHVDAAYGGFFVLTERGRQVLRGIEQADSITLDPHKSLFLPFGTGCLLVRDQEQLRRAHELRADYLPVSADEGGIVNPCDLSPELSRNHRGLRVWLPLKMHGIDVFRAALDEKIDIARYIAAELRHLPEVDLVVAPELSTLGFRLIGPDSRSEELLRLVNERGHVHLSATTVFGRFVIRVCVLSFRTHVEHAAQLLDDIRWGIAQLRSRIPLETVSECTNDNDVGRINHEGQECDDLGRHREAVLSRTGLDGCAAYFLSEATDSRDLDSVATLIARAFVEREPMTNVLYQKSPERTFEAILKFVRRVVADSATHDCSVMMKDDQGRVISAMIHVPYARPEFELPEALAAVDTVLTRLKTSFDGWLEKREDSPKILYGLMTAVHPDYAGHALMKHQLHLALYRAKQLGFSELASSATSVSQVVLERLGWRVIAQVDYADYQLFKDIHASTITTRYPLKSAKMMWCKIDDILPMAS